jgi:hypothetical protein
MRTVPTSRSLALALAVALGGLLLGCGGDDTQGDSDGSVGSDAQGDPTVRVGTFQVTLVQPNAGTGTAGYTNLVGKVYDGPTPQQTVWELSEAEGDCQLLEPRVPYCEAGCGADVCVEDDVCQAYPEAHPVGTVTVTGLRTDPGGTELEMDPIGTTYQPVGVTLAYPPFAEGDAVSLDAAGSAFTGPFGMEAEGIAPLQLLTSEIPLETGVGVALEWTPPADALADSRIGLLLDISHHGGSNGKIVCDLDDDGSFEIPAALITRLLALGVAGFPTIILTREARGSTTISAGRVDLALASKVEHEVTIAGLVSCNGDEDCPDPQTCQPDLRCQ